MAYYQNKTKQQQIAMQQAWQAYMRMDPMNCIVDPQGTKGGIYLGNIDAAQNVEMLHRHNIGAVLTVAARTGLKYDRNQIQIHEIIHADDVETFDLSKHFPKLLDFIERNLQHTNVLVHCFAGVSRSATTVIAYLMKTNDWSYEKSMFYCKSRRKVTNPNPGFVRQLLAFEARLRQKQNNSQLNGNQFDATANTSQSMFYQGSGPVRALPQSSHSNRNPLIQESTPSKDGKAALSMTMNSFKQNASYADQNSPMERVYGIASTLQPAKDLSQSALKNNYHDQTLASQYNNQNIARSIVKTGGIPLNEHARSQSQQSQRIQENSPHFGGSNKANQIESKGQLFSSAYGGFAKQPLNETKTVSFSNNLQQNDRFSAKERSTSQQPAYSQQVHSSGYDYRGGDQRNQERNSSVRQSIFPNQQNTSHFQNQQNFSNSLRSNYQKAPSYVVSQQTPKTIYGSSYLNLNKIDNRPYQFLNSQVTPHSVYSSSYGIAAKSANYNPKYYPTRRALFSDRPIF